jgi:hypothetical protein
MPLLVFAAAVAARVTGCCAGSAADEGSSSRTRSSRRTGFHASPGEHYWDVLVERLAPVRTSASFASGLEAIQANQPPAEPYLWPSS